MITVNSGQTATYVYNALNQRVRTVVGGATTGFIFNAGGRRVSEWSWNGTAYTQLKGHYYWGGQPVAYHTAGTGGATHFQHQDWLGTERLRTSYNGSVEGTYSSLPFGDGQSTTGADTDANHYATLDHDTETDTDHAQFRQYSNQQGRFLSPDSYSGSYNPGNPQSMNRYVYAMNSPLAYVDPSGLDCQDENGQLNIDYCDNPYDASRGGQGSGFEGGFVPSTYYGLGGTPQTPGNIGNPNSGPTNPFGDPNYLGNTWGVTSDPTNPSNTCESNILNATNNRFGTSFNSGDVANQGQYSLGAQQDQGTYNVNISVDPSDQPSGVSSGYYPQNWWSYIIGYGSTLHVVSGAGPEGLHGNFTQSVSSSGFTAHMDSAYPYNPIGFVLHVLINMTPLGGYPPC